MSPIHARKVALIFILTYCSVSPQFHVPFDPSFTTTNCSNGNLVPPRYWQAMCGFVKGNKSVLCILRNTTHQLHSFIFNFRAVLKVVIPRNQRNKQHCQFMKKIYRRHEFINPFHISNHQYRFQFLTSTHRLSRRSKAPEPT